MPKHETLNEHTETLKEITFSPAMVSKKIVFKNTKIPKLKCHLFVE